MNSESEFSSMNMNKAIFEQASELIHKLETQQRLDPRFLESQSESLQSVTDAISLLLKMLISLNAASWECRQSVPYAEMFLIRDENGNLQYCCKHDPEHCSPVR
jgi:hypothetical protein